MINIVELQHYVSHRWFASLTLLHSLVGNHNYVVAERWRWRLARKHASILQSASPFTLVCISLSAPRASGTRTRNRLTFIQELLPPRNLHTRTCENDGTSENHLQSDSIFMSVFQPQIRPDDINSFRCVWTFYMLLRLWLKLTGCAIDKHLMW